MEGRVTPQHEVAMEFELFGLNYIRCFAARRVIMSWIYHIVTQGSHDVCLERISGARTSATESVGLLTKPPKWRLTKPHGLRA